VRVNFNYFVCNEVFEYILNAILWVADHGWKLLPEYMFDPLSGRWRHKAGTAEPPLRLSDVSFTTSGVVHHDTVERADESVLDTYLVFAEDLARSLPEPDLDSAPAWESADLERLRWFDIAAETTIIRGGTHT
jgi:hypothetical protein